MDSEDKLVFIMALTRLLAGSFEMTGAFLMLAYKKIDTAFQINALLGLLGPLIFLLVSALGFVGLLGRITPGKIGLLLLGIILILVASRP
ncbi:MAG: DUF2619 domain-containing protein [Firmicutes bacterium]|nr:DUF2619 domain-containing protein [Bacillota bacterium]